MRPAWAVVLAAGESRRFGSPKALMDVAGRTALELIAATALEAGIGGIVVVTGYHRDAVASVVRHLRLTEARNPDPGRGMMSSVRVGAAAVPTGSELLVWPVDHPFVTADTVQSLLCAAEEYQSTNADATGPGTHRPRHSPIVVPVFGDEGGHPTLFPADLAPDILDLDDSGGLDRMLVSHPERVLRLVLEDPGVLRDVDRPSDL